MKTDARTGAALVLRDAPLPLLGVMPEEWAEAGVSGDVGLEGEVVVVFVLVLRGVGFAFWRPTFTKLNLRLRNGVDRLVGS